MLRAKIGFDTSLESRPTKSGGFFFQQVVWIFQPGAEYPVKILLVVPEHVGEAGGYPVGEYLLDLDTSFDQGRFKSADIGFSQKLIPFSEEVYQNKILLLQQQMADQAASQAQILSRKKSLVSSAVPPAVPPTDYGLKSKAA